MSERVMDRIISMKEGPYIYIYIYFCSKEYEDTLINVSSDRFVAVFSLFDFPLRKHFD